VSRFRITFTEIEGKRQQGDDYDPAHPLTEDVDAVRVDTVNAVWEFYDEAGTLLHTAGRDAVKAIEEITGEEGGASTPVPATSGAAPTPPAGQSTASEPAKRARKAKS
jgi:hypothetical protein